MKTIILALSCVSLLSCSSTRQMKTNGSRNDEFILRFNVYAQGRLAKITFADGRQITGIKARIADNRVAWEHNNQIQSSSVDSLYLVRFTDHGKGARVGMRNGMVLGALVGGVDSFFGNHPYEIRPPSTSEKLQIAIAVGFVTGLIGGVSGLVIGAVIGHTESFQFGETRYYVSPADQ